MNVAKKGDTVQVMATSAASIRRGTRTTQDVVCSEDKFKSVSGVCCFYYLEEIIIDWLRRL